MIHAADKNSLIQSLKGMSFDVPAERANRTNEQVEKWAIARVLSTLAGSDHFEFPLEVIHSDRPDFRINFSDHVIGVEHTEAIPQNEAKKSVIREDVESPDVFFLTKHSLDEEVKSKRELVAEILENRSGDGWAGDSPERQWADVMIHFADRKAKKFQNGYSDCTKKWVLIYDNWPLPNVHFDVALPKLVEKLSYNNIFEDLDAVCILDCRQLCLITSTTSQLYTVNNLWK